MLNYLFALIKIGKHDSLFSQGGSGKQTSKLTISNSTHAHNI